MKKTPRAQAAETVSAPPFDADFLDAVREESAEFLASLGTLTLDEEDLRQLFLSPEEMRKIALDVGVPLPDETPKGRTRR